MPKKWFRMSCADIFFWIFQFLFCFLDSNAFFPITGIVSYIIFPGNLKKIHLNRKEFHNGADINTEFRVVTKPPPTDPEFTLYINIDFLVSSNEVFNGEIKQQIRMNNREPEPYWKYLFNTFS